MPSYSIVTATHKSTPTQNNTPIRQNTKSEGKFEWMLHQEIKKLKEKENGTKS